MNAYKRLKWQRISATTAVLALLLAACGAEEPDESPQDEADGTDTEEAAADDDDGDEPDEAPDAADEPRTLNFGHIYDPAAPYHVCGVEEVAAYVEEHSDSLTLNLFPSAQLGNQPEMAEQMSAGELELGSVGYPILADQYEPIGVLGANYVFIDADHGEAILETDLVAELEQGVLEAANLRTLGHWYEGQRHVTSNVPIREPEDLRGLQFRAPGSGVMLENAKSLGADPIAMALGEVYLAMQQGLVDAQENPLPTIQTQGFHEVQDYLSLTGHRILFTAMVVSEDVWQTLSEAQQQVISDAIEYATPLVRDCTEEDEESILAEWEAEGAIEIIDDVDREAFAARSEEHLLEVFGDVWGDRYLEIRAQANG